MCDPGMRPARRLQSDRSDELNLRAEHHGTLVYRPEAPVSCVMRLADFRFLRRLFGALFGTRYGTR